MDQKDWVTALQLRGRSFRRNVEMYRMLTKIRTPKKKDAANVYNIAIMNIGSPSGGNEKFSHFIASKNATEVFF